jgi:DNA-binding FadR family transcriptional regulator
VREALRLLASQHLIVTTRGVTGGSFVAHPDAGQLADGLAAGFTLLANSADVSLADMLELRRAIEVPAAGLAAARRTPEHLAEIRGTLFEPGADDFDRRLAAHVAFHLAVAKATGNPLFELVVRPLYCASYGEDLHDTLPPGYWERMDADHRQLLDRLAVQDTEGASTAATRHLDYIVAVTS